MMSKEKHTITYTHGPDKKVLHRDAITGLSDRIFDERDRTRSRIHDLLAIGLDIVSCGKARSFIRRYLSPAFDAYEHMEKLRDAQKTIAAIDGKETVGMVGYEKCGTDVSTGRPIYEIRRLSVASTHEGQGIGRGLYNCVREKILAECPDALILVQTRNPVVENICRKGGYSEKGLGDALRYRGVPDDQIPDILQRYEASERAAGWKYFLLDPSTPQDSSGS